MCIQLRSFVFAFSPSLITLCTLQLITIIYCLIFPELSQDVEEHWTLIIYFPTGWHFFERAINYFTKNLLTVVELIFILLKRGLEFVAYNVEMGRKTKELAG